MTSATQMVMNLTEQSLVPDIFVRKGIQRLVRNRLGSLRIDNCETQNALIRKFVANMNSAPIAPLPEKANEQHYEIPAEFYNLVLGKHRKYSSCYWNGDNETLDDAERNSLIKTCEHMDLIDGQKILELGCGWGSLTVWMARQYKNSQITAVSNSNSQRKFIMAEAEKLGLKNINVITADMNEFSIDEKFDRVVSIEMFEHMRNYETLMKSISNWLKPSGKFFMHIFCHRDTPYEFVVRDESDWMSQYFFSGGIMPCDDLPLYFQKDLKLVDRWRWNGTHYARTAEAWLMNMDKNRKHVYPILEETYGKDKAGIWFERWRIFFMACAELFGYENGQQWWVSHYLFENQQRAS